MTISPLFNKKTTKLQALTTLLGNTFCLLMILLGTPVLANDSYKGIAITVSGSGPDLIFIPGLNSGAGAFTEVCDALQSNYRCHLMQLPGFAGTPPIADVESGFLPVMQERIISYIHEENLTNPVIIGHSLGGFLALLISAQETQLLSGLIIVDALPYLPAGQNPMATVELMQGLAEQIKSNFGAVSDQQFEQQTRMQLMSMTNKPQRMPLLLEWAISSDRATTGQAIYEMQTIDLRPRMNRITTPTLVLGSWAAYENFGSTKATTRAIFEKQYQLMPDKTIELSDTGFHFLMWDDPQWLLGQVQKFLNQLQ